MIAYRKDPNALLDYAIDWSAWLPDGDAITTAVWTVPDGLTRDHDTLAGAVATVWIGGGAVGTVYRLTCQISTAAGRSAERSISIEVIDR